MRPPLRAASYEALFGLLAVSGMRIGEALALQRDYVDLTAGVITIADAKGSRPRVVPLHASATEALARYAVRRDDLCSKPRSKAFFLSAAGAALTYSRVHAAFVKLTSQIGLRTATVPPRIHHLRHSFAVRTLVDHWWWRAARAPAIERSPSRRCRRVTSASRRCAEACAS